MFSLQVDAVFISEFLGVKNNLQLASDRIDGCSLQGYSMMMRKDNTLATWWNPALNALIASTEYREICNGLEDESIHGKVSLFLIFFFYTEAPRGSTPAKYSLEMSIRLPFSE